MWPIVLKSGSLNLLEPSGLVQAFKMIALPFYLSFIHLLRLPPSLVFFRSRFPSVFFARFIIIYLPFPSYISFALISSGKYRSKHVLEEQQ
jgi:hypothetical protein